MTRQDYINKISSAHDKYIALLRQRGKLGHSQSVQDALLREFNEAHNAFQTAMPKEYLDWISSAFDE